MSANDLMTEVSMTVRNEVLAKVVEYIINAGDLKLKAEEVTENLSLKEDLDLDSVGSLTAIMDLEEHYGIVIDDKQLLGLQTVGDVVAMIEAGLANRPAAKA